jgi:PEP-CTERM motif
MRRNLLVFLAVIAAAHFAFAQAQFAATVNLYITTVNATPSGGTWQVYAADSDNNDGLANWSLDILGSGGAVVNTPAVIQAPRPVDPSGQYADGLDGTMGFSKQVSNGFNSGTSRLSINATQYTTYGPTDDPTYDMGILVGVGQEPSSASPQNGTQGPINGSGSPTGIATPVWNYTPLTMVSGGAGAPSYPIAGTLIEHGTYTTTDSQGSLTVQTYNYNSEFPGMGQGFVEVLGTSDGGMNELFGDAPYQVGNTPFATALPETINLPEPASLGLLGIGIGFINAFSRRSRRRPQHTSKLTR